VFFFRIITDSVFDEIVDVNEDFEINLQSKEIVEESNAALLAMTIVLGILLALLLGGNIAFVIYIKKNGNYHLIFFSYWHMRNNKADLFVCFRTSLTSSLSKSELLPKSETGSENRFSGMVARSNYINNQIESTTVKTKPAPSTIPARLGAAGGGITIIGSAEPNRAIKFNENAEVIAKATEATEEHNTSSDVESGDETAL
jgi:hypothetical protein